MYKDELFKQLIGKRVTIFSEAGGYTIIELEIDSKPVHTFTIKTIYQEILEVEEINETPKRLTFFDKKSIAVIKLKIQ